MLNIERKTEKKIVKSFISFEHLGEEVNDSYILGKKDVVEVVLYGRDGSTNTLFAVDMDNEETIVINEDYNIVRLVPNFEQVGQTIKELVEDDFPPQYPPVEYTLSGNFTFELNIKER